VVALVMGRCHFWEVRLGKSSLRGHVVGRGWFGDGLLAEQLIWCCGMG